MSDEQIPTYRGRTPDAMHITFSGKDEELGTVFDVDEPVTLLVRGVAKKATFSTNQFDILTLTQSVKVSGAMLVDEEMREAMEAEMKRRQDEASGQTSLDDELETEHGLTVVDDGDDDDE